MRVGLFFGSFDPPHIGHVNVVSGEETPQDLPKNVHVVYVPQITICSTCIRNRVKLGVYIQPFVKDTVEAFIDQYRLYV